MFISISEVLQRALLLINYGLFQGSYYEGFLNVFNVGVLTEYNLFW